MTEVTGAIPFTAWEQAVFVGLFILVVMGLLWWFGKQSKDWQNFIDHIDDKWRAFNKEQRDSNLIEMKEVKNGLQKTTEILSSLVEQTNNLKKSNEDLAFEIHNGFEAIKTQPIPRRRKVTSQNE